MDRTHGTLTPREAVLKYVRDIDNAALQRHTGLVGSDGMGTIFIECGCERRWSLDAWPAHLRNVIALAHKQKR